MAGPYPPEYGAGPAGPRMYPQSSPQQPFPPTGAPGNAAEPYPEPIPSAYPGMLPPPVQYQKKRRWPVVVGAAVAVLVVAAVVTAIVLASGNEEGAQGAGVLTDASAQAAIGEYLDALSNGDDETVARHSLCGLYDAVKERRSDLALANLSSDAFRKQYSRAEVASIDKMVRSSPHQAQVLFTMKVTPADGSTRDQPGTGELQAVAQLLAYDGDVLVCSYLPRAGGQY